MISVDSNNKVALDKEFLECLGPRQQQDAQQAADIVNQLFSEIAANKGEVGGGQPSTAPTQQAKALVQEAIGLLQKDAPKNGPKALQLLDRALLAVQKRPLYEPAQLTIMEVCNVLGPRCDAHMALGDWPKAYADACMNVLLNPKDPHAYFRKSVCLHHAGQTKQAEIMVQYSVLLAPQIKLFSDFAAKLKSEL